MQKQDKNKYLAIGAAVGLAFLIFRPKNAVWLPAWTGINTRDYADPKTIVPLGTNSNLCPKGGSTDNLSDDKPRLVGYWVLDKNGEISGGYNNSSNEYYLILKSACNKNVYHRIYESQINKFYSNRAAALKASK